MSDRLLALPLIEEARRRQVVALRMLDPIVGRIELTMSPGATVADAVALAFPGARDSDLDQIRVTIGADEIPRALWGHVRPKLWDTILIRFIGGASDLFRTVLLAAVTIAAIAAGQLYLGPALAGVIGAESAGALAVTNSLATGALLIGGTLLVNALVPPSSGKQDGSKQTFAINGYQNQATPNGVVPCPLGKIRFAPPYAVLPYTQNSGDDQYFIGIFLIGYSALVVTEPCIGLTPASHFQNVDCQIIESYSTGDALPYYDQQVIEESLSISLTNAGGSQSRVGAKDATETEIDLFFPAGLFFVNSSGDQDHVDCHFQIQQRLVGTTSWTNVIADWTIDEFKNRAFWRSYRWSHPRGQYETNITRNTIDDEFVTDNHLVSRSSWVALRSYRPEAPLNYSDPVAIAVVRIRANGQLNGTLDTFNVLASRKCLDWDDGVGAWLFRETQNPAALARYVRQGIENILPDSDDQLDLTDIQDWANFCATKGLQYNAVHDQVASRDEVLTQVCHAGRALPYDRGDKWTAIVDKPRTQFYDHISPRNSSGLVEHHPSVAFPDAISCKFKDQSNNYVDAQRIVPWPGFIGDPINIEEWPQPGKTDPDEVWREIRRRQYEAIYRRKSWTVSQDFEHFAIDRGAAAYLAHQVIDRHTFAGRVKSVVTAGGTTIISLDADVEMETGQMYQARFRNADQSSFTRTVITQVGMTRSLTLTGVGSTPVVDSLVMFGRYGEVTKEVIVKSIEQGQNYSAVLTLIDHAPEIDSILDSEEPPPPWDGRVGVEI